MNFKLHSLILTLFICLASARAQAGGSIGLAYATGESPYKDYDRRQTALPLVHYENDAFYLRGLSLGAKLFNQDSIEVSAFLAYDPHRFKSKDSGNARLKRLNDRREGILAGGRLLLARPIGVFSAELAGDVSGHSRGLVGQLRLAKPFDLEPWTLTPAVGLYWASENYNDYYYGISGKESRASGLPAYQAGADFSPFAAFKVDLALDERKRFNLFGQVETVFLPSAVKDSPMVGRSTTTSLTTGLIFGFE